MLNHLVMWNYWSVWKPPVRVVWEPKLDDVMPLVEPEDVISEQEAYGRVMSKVRAGAAPTWWAETQGLGYC
jgi:hypothetical protein